MKYIFETSRLLIREFGLCDCRSVYEIYGDWDVMQSFGELWMLHPGDTRKIEEFKQRNENYPAGMGIWATFLKTEMGSPLIGHILLKPLDDIGLIEVGYSLAKSHWGQGYATEAALGAIRYGFVHFDMNEIVAIARQHNQPSIKVMKRCGMRYQKMIDYKQHKDMVLYSLTREEWHKVGCIV